MENTVYVLNQIRDYGNDVNDTPRFFKTGKQQLQILNNYFIPLSNHPKYTIDSHVVQFKQHDFNRLKLNFGFVSVEPVKKHLRTNPNTPG